MICVCFGNSIIQTAGVWWKSNVASCYIQVKTSLVKAEIAREATEVTKPGRVEPFWLVCYGKKRWEPKIWIFIIVCMKVYAWKLWYLTLDDLVSSFNQKLTKRSVTVAIMVAGSSVVSMKIKRGNEAVLLFFIIYTSCYVTVVMMKYKVWRESRIGSQ